MSKKKDLPSKDKPLTRREFLVIGGAFAAYLGGIAVLAVAPKHRWTMIEGEPVLEKPKKPVEQNPVVENQTSDESEKAYQRFEQPANGGKILELDERLADHFGTLNEKNTPFLKSGIVQTAIGKTDYTQQVNLGDLAVKFGEDERDRVGHFLTCRDGENIFTYQMTFTSGLRAEKPSDFHNAQLNVLGKDYQISNVEYGKDQLTLELTAKDNSRKISLSNRLNSKETRGIVLVNDERIVEASVYFTGKIKGGNIEITTLQYALEADPLLGDLFAQPGSNVKEHLDAPDGMLGFNIHYDGFKPHNDVTIVRIDMSDNKKSASLEFTNNEGIWYDVPLAAEQNGKVKLGNRNGNAFHVKEESIKFGEFFVVNKPGTDFTHILRYDTIDTTTRQLTFTDVGTGTREVTYDRQTNEGVLTCGGVSYKIKLNLADKSIMVDSDCGGAYASGRPYIASKHGLKISCSDDGSIYFSIPREKLDGNPAQGEAVGFALRPKNGTLETELLSESAMRLWQLEENPNLEQGLTRYGLFFERHADQNITIEVPEKQREMSVRFSSGN